MKTYQLLALFLLLISVGTRAENPPKYKNGTIPVEERVSDLLAKMTLKEKIGQLMQVVLVDVDDAMIDSVRQAKVSSFCVGRESFPSPDQRNKLQRVAVEETRLGIPIIFGFDLIHGYKTIFPTPLGTSASWNTELAKEAAYMSAKEVKAVGMDLAFSPMIDVARDPRWGRISEGYGEDVLLNGKFGRAVIEGYQHPDANGFPTIGACMKHFAGYGAVIGGRDYQYTEISERTLRETYLPPFHEGVKAGVVSVMSAFNDISGVPASANNLTMNSILKKEWNFDGFVLSDWDAVIELINHGIVDNSQGAALAAIQAGLDMEMKSDSYWTLIQAIQSKKITEKTINEAVKRVLRIKFRLGLFENPYINVDQAVSAMKTKEALDVARKIATESMVLLKNENILPLANQGTVSLMGEWVHSRDVYGWWVGNGDYQDVVTVWEGMTANKPPQMRIISGSETQIRPDVAVVCVGESGNSFGENNNRASLDIPFGQVEMIKQLKESGIKVVAVIFNGRPLVLTEIEKYADAIVLAWHPGTESGNALADILFGKVNPSGKLTCSFPKQLGQVPLYYSEKLGGRPQLGDYATVDKKPLYPFGYGLSYTSFEYSNLKITKRKIKSSETLIVSADITNTGKVKGKEVVQLYVHDKVASVTRPRKELKDFQKIELMPGETKTVSFSLNSNQLMLLNQQMQWVTEPGEFDVWIAPNAVSGLQGSFFIE